MATQASRAERLALADDVIANDEEHDRLRARVAELHQHYLACAKAMKTYFKQAVEVLLQMLPRIMRISRFPNWR